MSILQGGFFGFFAGAVAGFLFVVVSLSGGCNGPCSTAGAGGAFGVIVVFFAFGGTLVGFVVGAVLRLFNYLRSKAD